MTSVLERNGLVSFEPQDEDFDPNFHDAKFEVPASSVEHRPGTVALVLKRGYKLHERVVRPAAVGVYRRAQ